MSLSIVKQKIVYFESLNYFNIPIILFLRLLFFKVHYIDLSYGLRSERIISVFKKIGIHFKTFNDFDDPEESRIFLRAKNMAERAGTDYFGNSIFCKTLSRDWGLNQLQNEKFRQVIRNKFYENIFISLSKIVTFVKLDKKKHAEWIFYLISNSPEANSMAFRKLFFESDIRIPLLFKVLTYVNSIFYVIDKFAFSIIVRKLKSVVFFNCLHKPVNSSKSSMRNALNEDFIEKLKKKDVIYFPHKEISYGALYVKNYFFSSDMHSMLFYKKIFNLFFESTDIISRRYFKLFGMEYEEHLSDHVAKECATKVFFMKYRNSFLKDLKKLIHFYRAIILMNSFLTIERYRLFFSKLTHLKLCLLGYEQLFPREINLALSINGIPVAAAMERFTGFIHMGFMNHDYHFVWGSRMKEISEVYGKNILQTYVPVGMPRLDQYYFYKLKQPPIKKYELIRRRHKFLILALDLHFPENFYWDGMRQNVAKSKHILNFYDALLYIAGSLDVHIIIKGKISDYRSPFMQDYLDKINKCHNIEIENRIEIYKPYKILNYFDLIVNLHTSLAEEAMVAGKDVIFYDPAKFIENSFFNYDRYGIVAKDRKELISKTRLCLEGKRLYKDEEAFRAFLSNTFGDGFDGNVKRRIQKYLEKNVLNG